MNEIKTQLIQLSQRENIKILLAIESGSRAWGFPSPDSDYDVRIIYQRNPKWYLSIDDKKDSIDYFHGELLDIAGWDIRKTLRLVRRSNATPFEWAQSPIVYQEDKNFRAQLMQFANTFFQARHSFNHYLGIAKNSYFSNFEGSNIKLKKLFYVLRPILAAKWILEKQHIPPMEISALMAILRDDKIKLKINKLIQTKAHKKEDFVYELDEEINDFIKLQFETFEKHDLAIVTELPSSNILDVFYQKLTTEFYL